MPFFPWTIRTGTNCHLQLRMLRRSRPSRLPYTPRLHTQRSKPLVYIVLSCRYWKFLLYILLRGDCLVQTSPWSKLHSSTYCICTRTALKCPRWCSQRGKRSSGWENISRSGGSRETPCRWAVLLVNCPIRPSDSTTFKRLALQKGHNSKCRIVCKMLNFGQSLKAVLHLLNSCQLKLM